MLYKNFVIFDKYCRNPDPKFSFKGSRRPKLITDPPHTSGSTTLYLRSFLFVCRRHEGIWSWIFKFLRSPGLDSASLCSLAASECVCGGGGLLGGSNTQRKLIDWKKTKPFRFRWNWDEEKKLRGIRLQISSPSPPRRAPPNLSPYLFRRGCQGFCRYYYCRENALDRDER